MTRDTRHLDLLATLAVVVVLFLHLIGAWPATARAIGQAAVAAFDEKG